MSYNCKNDRGTFMKYDLNKKPTIGEKRTLLAFQDAFYQLLTAMSFEDLTVKDLCAKSMIPRATFYNYFDDKYDLLAYSWITIRQWIQEHIGHERSFEKMFDAYIEKLLDYFDEELPKLRQIVDHNSTTQYLLSDFRNFLSADFLAIFKKGPRTWKFKVPLDIVAQLYANAVLITLHWKYTMNVACTKQEMREFFNFIVNIDHLTKG